MLLGGKSTGKFVDEGHITAKKVPKVKMQDVVAKRFLEADSDDDEMEYRLDSGKIFEALRKGKSISR